MPTMSTESVFLPYLCGNEGLSLKLVGATVDGRREEVQSDSESVRVDLFTLGDEWRQVSLSFLVTLDGAAPKVKEMVPRSERGKPSSALLGSLHRSRTVRRCACTGSW